jgi:hypothetical protein
MFIKWWSLEEVTILQLFHDCCMIGQDQPLKEDEVLFLSCYCTGQNWKEVENKCCLL